LPPQQQDYVAQQSWQPQNQQRDMQPVLSQQQQKRPAGQYYGQHQLQNLEQQPQYSAQPSQYSVQQNQYPTQQSLRPIHQPQYSAEENFYSSRQNQYQVPKPQYVPNQSQQQRYV
jgi:hypothetical protein